MKVLLRQVLINDPASSLNSKVLDVFVEDGKFSMIAKSINEKELPAGVKVIEEKGLQISPGWFDMRAYFREPGEEQKETIKSGQDAAAQGGFTGVLLMPSTKNPVQSRSAVEFVNKKSDNHAVSVYQSGCLTVNREGKDLAEIFDMQLGGSIAFTDDKRSIKDSGVMLRAMQYANSLNALIIAYADDKGVSGNAIANESANTTLLGFKGAPAIAEEIEIQRLCSLLRYTGSALHISGISSKEAVEVIRKAKAEGLKITCEVYIHHLLLSDDALNDFDSNYKIKPPLRSIEDKQALIEAVIDGTIDCIASDHSPQDIESKAVEFDYADFGMISLESFYPVLINALGKQTVSKILVERLSITPRRIAGLPLIKIEEGEKADFTIYNPGEEWIFKQNNIQSLSSNSAFIGRKFNGKVKGVYNNKRFIEAR